ncbi:hypothetical protein [Streptococcus plurextorum]|uniref:hypothetical protein n=1 Tax=Streptococcus plurextorum TaxID=456876 RepID=UPI0003FEC034|nr:hypothetical protein [Streptococcus plurextorum]
MKKVSLLLLALLTVLTFVNVSALTYDTFFGGVTGVPGWGETWGMYSPRSSRVYVTAKGKSTKTSYTRPQGLASATVQRAISGNVSYWGYW